MNKTKLLNFIAKYHLGGNVESVEWEVKDNQLLVSFITDDKTVKGDVVLKEFNFKDCELPIYTTSDLTKMVTVLGDSVEFDVNDMNGKLVSIKLSDNNSKLNFMLAESGVIPQVPKLKGLPEFDLEIKLTDEFTDRFIKAKNALPDINDFALVFDKNNEPKIVIGYSEKNSNRISLNVDVDVTNEIDPVRFSAKYLKVILSSNKEASGGTLKISSKGLTYITFESDSYNSKYYLVKIDSIN